MLPTVVSSDIERALFDYLRTTFRLTDRRLDEALFRYLRDGQTGMFRGPYLDVRLPFRKAGDDWGQRSPLDFGPAFVPYAHQLQAFARLSARDRQPQNTLVTTGTGSGKTECFLFPVLDHCRRARQRGQQGIKAIILYPMNALASDQAERLAKLLTHDALEKVSAGLYVGGQGQHSHSGPTHLIDDRQVLRESPPDILLTNYRMLDFLLMRPEDAPLWENSALQYLVLDELHTYDGAQGSDVACLIRRLKARLDVPRGHLCCVGTSATIGSGGTADPKALLAAFAEKIFAEPFSVDCLIHEDRLAPDEAFSSFEIDPRYPYDKDPIDAQPLNPANYQTREAYLAAQIPMWLKKERGPAVLGMDLGAHPFMTRVLRALAGKERRSGPRDLKEIIEGIATEDSDFGQLAREHQWLVLSSFVSLIAHARSVEEGNKQQPFLHVQLQLWLRELHGLLRCVGGENPRFSWQDELKATEGEHWLPMVFCRECGFDGFAAIKREGEDHLRDAPSEIGEAFLRRGNRGRVIEVLKGDAPTLTTTGQAELVRETLCPRCLKVGFDAECHCTAEATPTLPVKLHPGKDEKNHPLPLHRCPRCQADDGIGFLASRASTLSSVAVSELFSTRFNADKKLLAFTDSVQDASHRAGFFAARTFRFSMRTAIQSYVEKLDEPARLSDFTPGLIDHWIERRKEARAAALLVPPDLSEDPAYVAYFGLEKASDQQDAHKPTAAQRHAMRELLEVRTSWEVTREYGLAVSFGRSLDGTVSSSLAFDAERLEAAAQEFTEHLREHHRAALRQDPGVDSARHYLGGLLQRLRLRGGVYHPLLEDFIKEDKRYRLSKRMNPRLSRFGLHSEVPSFWVQGEATLKSSYQALHSGTKSRNWYRVWTSRALELLGEQDASVNAILDRAVRALRDHGLVRQFEGKGDSAVFGIDPDHVFVTRDVMRVRCSTCSHRLTLSQDAARYFSGRPCTAFACAEGTYTLETGHQSEELEQYYQRLYKSGETTRIFTGEHTGLLDRDVREALERSFKAGTRPAAPNLLTCTPTLEMGIDIGDLSAVMLCSVPPLPSNYVQRVGRAGRSTGNAAILTVANRKPHDRYFYEQPYEMLRGEISPPGCFLDAPEMLTRQLLAHAMDTWAKERPRGAGAVIPHRMQLLRVNAEDPFPGQFWAYYQENKTRLTEVFLALFGDAVSSANQTRLRQLSLGEGLAGEMKEALQGVKEQIKDYTEQLKTIRTRIDELQEHPNTASLVFSDEEGKPVADSEVERLELEDSERAYSRLRAELQNKYPLNVLSDAGVIPNYAFPEPGVTLSALLRDPFDENEKTKGKSKKVEYLRAASQALREFAPFNTFYAEGHKIRISQLDLGNKAAHIEYWRVCRSCHHMKREPGGVEPEATCPRCDDPHWSDVGQRRPLVRFRRALSMMNRLEASTAEDSEDRDSVSYKLAELIDVGPQNIGKARLVQRPDLVFGFELLRRQTLREVNFGRLMDVAKPSSIAGQDIAQRGFLVCKLCGKVSDSEERADHSPICGVRRKNDKPVFERVYLYREFTSEAIRLLLPVSQLEDPALLSSLKAALFLGFRKKFLGHPDHLGITLVNEPRGGDLRRFLVVYDRVPGGTGYLAELWENDGILEVLEKARDAMQTCRCAEDETKDGCYRCLYAYQHARDIRHISRVRAIEAIDAILAARADLVTVETLSNASVDDLTESELERKFLAALQSLADAPGTSWMPTQQGGKACHVLKTPNSQWLIKPQVDIGPESGVLRPSRPDFVLRCLSSTTELPIAVFCDGLRYHVCPGQAESRLGDDIGKRSALLDSGQFRVWSVTWKDLDDACSVTTLLTRVQRELYHTMFPEEARWMRDDTLKGHSSFRLLWEYLEDPNADVWTAMSRRFAASMLQTKNPWTAESIKAEQDALRNGRDRAPSRLAEAKKADGAPKRWAGLDARASAVLLFQIAAPALAKRAFDDGDLTLRLYDDARSRSEPEFEESWRAFLHAWNILQFHPRPPQAVSTELLSEGLEAPGPVTAPPATRGPSTRPPAEPADDYARLARDFADGQHIATLADALRLQRLPLPVEGSELDVSRDLDALLVWPRERVALIPDCTDDDKARWRAEGWTALDYNAPAEIILAALTGARA